MANLQLYDLHSQRIENFHFSATIHNVDPHFRGPVNENGSPGVFSTLEIIVCLFVRKRKDGIVGGEWGC
jgi:hypothetical protein